MTKLYLPNHIGEAYRRQQEAKRIAEGLFRQIIVIDPNTGKEKVVLVPKSEHYESKAQEQEIVEKATEDTLADMRREDAKEKPKYSKSEIGGELNDFNIRRKKARERTAPRRYEGGWDAP